jgi:uncharacterized protein YndB with AHSA1/START domain
MPRPSTRRLSLRIERRFNAPVKRVWKAWTSRTDMVKWFGEGPERVRVHELDARPGGRLRISSGGDRVGNYFGLFISVRPSRELVLIVIDVPSRWAETVRVRLQARRRSTRMIFESSLALASVRAATRKGWSASFDRLADAIGDA